MTDSTWTHKVCGTVVEAGQDCPYCARRRAEAKITYGIENPNFASLWEELREYVRRNRDLYADRERDKDWGSHSAFNNVWAMMDDLEYGWGDPGPEDDWPEESPAEEKKDA